MKIKLISFTPSQTYFLILSELIHSRVCKALTWLWLTLAGPHLDVFSPELKRAPDTWVLHTHLMDTLAAVPCRQLIIINYMPDLYDLLLK